MIEIRQDNPLPTLDPAWLAQMRQAVLSGNEAAMWQVVRQAPSEEAAMQAVADTMPRLAYQHRNQVILSELFMAPVLIPAGSDAVFTDHSVWMSASQCLEEACQSWFLPTRANVKLYKGLRPYDWLGTWKPSVLREHLNVAAPGQGIKASRFLTEFIELPPHAPRLGFLFIVANSSKGWLTLPSNWDERDSRFRTVIASALQVNSRDGAPVVYPPERVQFAVSDGICKWLEALNLCAPIKGWSVEIQASTPDLVRVNLQLDDEKVPATQFTVRKHQVGTYGLSDILGALGAFAPMIDKPMDAVLRTAHVTLPLT